jgi:uncharacterized protein (TIGR02444 family)
MATIGEQRDFWRFSLEIYGRPAVSPALILLQDRDGKDVNILLFCLYAGLVLGRRIGSEDIAALQAAVGGWSETVTQKLRAVRRDLKPMAADPEIAALRRAVQAAELDAERLAQARLEAALPAGPREAAGIELARVNLLSYAGEATAALIELLA